MKRRSGRRLPVVLLESAVVMSGAGNGVAAVAIPWLVLERTGRPSAAALVGAATAVPLMLSGFFSGAIVDTLGRRRTSVLSDIFSAVSVTAIPVVDAFFGLDIAVLMFLVVLGALFDPAGATARESMIPEFAETAEWSLERMNGLHEAMWGVAYMLGPGLGGVLIATVGAVGALWATSIGFLLSALAIAVVKAPGLGTPALEDRPRNLLAGAVDGMRIAWRDPVMRSMFVLLALLVAAFMPIEGLILPVVFEAINAPQRLGVVLMALSAGGIGGSLLYGSIGSRFSRRKALLWSSVFAGLAVLGMSALPAFPLLVFFSALAGFAWGPIGPLFNLAIQTRTSPHNRGRVLGVMISGEYAAGPLGYLVVGQMVERLGVRPAFLAVGAFVVAVSTLIPLMPALREFDAAEEPDAEVALADCKPPGTDHIG